MHLLRWTTFRSLFCRSINGIRDAGRRKAWYAKLQVRRFIWSSPCQGTHCSKTMLLPIRHRICLFQAAKDTITVARDDGKKKEKRCRQFVDFAPCILVVQLSCNQISYSFLVEIFGFCILVLCQISLRKDIY